jgi:hypothetical protein
MPRVRTHSQYMTSAARAMADRTNFRAPVVAGCHAPPILQPAEHDFDPVPAFVPALVILYRFLPLLPARDAGAYPFVFQRFPEPIGVIAAIPEQPIGIRQAAQQCPCPDVIADLTRRDEQVQWPAFAVADGVQLGVHAALGATDQASTPPFLTPKLVAVRWAFR